MPGDRIPYSVLLLTVELDVKRSRHKPVVGHQVFLASTLQWYKPKLPEDTVTNTTTSVNITELELIDITDMSSAAIQEMFDASRRKAGDNVMLQVLDLLEYGRSQTLTAEHLQVIKSYVDEMLGC